MSRPRSFRVDNILKLKVKVKRKIFSEKDLSFGDYLFPLNSLDNYSNPCCDFLWFYDNYLIRLKVTLFFWMDRGVSLIIGR